LVYITSLSVVKQKESLSRLDNVGTGELQTRISRYKGSIMLENIMLWWGIEM
jgi:hypothetical protein